MSAERRWIGSGGCLRCLLLVMCTHPFAKEALTLHLARSEGHERYLGCNSMHRKVLASSHQHLMAEAPARRLGAGCGKILPHDFFGVSYLVDGLRMLP